MLLALSLTSCATDQLEKLTETVSEPLSEITSKIVLINPLEQKGDFKRAHYCQEGNFNPLYMGAMQDTILLNHDYLFDTCGICFEPSVSFGFMEPHDLHLDTCQTITIRTAGYDFENESFSEGLNLAYPLYMRNTSSDTIIIGLGNHISLVLEAKNQFGEWQVIETIYNYICGTGLNFIISYPDQVTVTAVPIYQGSFKTQCRVRLGKSISESFEASIDLTQFLDYYDTHGYD